MRFRVATAADVPAVVALVESAYRGETSRSGWTTEADLLDGQRTDLQEVSRLVAGPASRIVIAEEPGRLVGSVLIREEEDPACAYIGMFAVHPRMQSCGLGSALLAEAERVSQQELGRRSARMTVLIQRTELIAWYERRGYRRTGHHEPFPYGDPRFGLPRRPDLVFEVLKKDFVAMP